MSKLVSIVITATSKLKKNLEKLLLSIHCQINPPHKIIILTPCLLKQEEASFADIHLLINCIENKNQLLLTSLQNQTFLNTKEEYILLLNDDVILDKYFIGELIRVMMDDEKIGIACGKLLRMDGRTIDSAGQFLAKGRKPIERGYGQPDLGQFEKPGLVFGACGAAVLYRKQMLEDIAITPGEYFDNDYHMFYEDLDISWRANKFGWKTFYNPKAIAYHVRGATAKTKKPKLKFLEAYYFAWLDKRLKTDLIKNRYLTIIKDDTLKEFLLNLPFILWYDLKLWVYCLIFEPIIIWKTFKNLSLIFRAFKKRSLIFKKIKKKNELSDSFTS